MLSKLGDEFEARNCKVLAVTGSSTSTIRSFVRDTQELQACQVSFPIVADATGEVLAGLGMKSAAAEDNQGFLPQTTLYLIDLDKRVRLMMQYPAVVGCNFYEALRAMDALQVSVTNLLSGKVFARLLSKV
eukprot:TRINITY_DN425_c0_g1_i1.p2 TRINITY_DN425_c0_g1~~TRINITY_DN425_c0_g1_i1.p2  ORF type:complete len:131 (+),score=10.27 TRINITY_DN425_c0_g1_i1:324-716(+)